MERERFLIGLWALLSSCWICVILAANLAVGGLSLDSFLVAIGPPALVLLSGYLVAWVWRGPVEP